MFWEALNSRKNAGRGIIMTLLLPFEIERPVPVQAALTRLSMQEGVEERGAIFTRPEVVEGILDLCRYTSNRNLHEIRLLEPSFGNGEFLIPAIRRLLDSCRRIRLPLEEWPCVLSDALFAVEIHKPTFEKTYARIVGLLEKEGLCPTDAEGLVSGWLKQDDFLLTPIHGYFQVVIGNPPYVRQERVPNALLKEYKQSFSTLYDRADLYVIFFERCLDLLVEKGVLGFICANRWVKNKYGGPLRAKISSGFNLDIYIDLERVNAFNATVDAYPAITIISRTFSKTTTVINEPSLDVLLGDLKKPRNEWRSGVEVVRGLINGSDPWLLDTCGVVEVLRKIEARFPTLEESGVKVGIGVATGCDKVYIGPFDELPVEDERKLPLALASSLKGQQLDWKGHGLVNPWLDSGALASFDDFPRFANYMKEHEPSLRARHTAKQSPHKWYKTIDRVYADLTHTPKLLIPDIKGEATIVHDPGRYYPHHNLYVITSSTWDLQVLQAFLRSSVALMFVAAYSVRMSGGYLRFQAQYLRRIRIPNLSDLDPEMQDQLRKTSTMNQDELDDLAIQAFGLSPVEEKLVRNFAAKARVSKARE